MDIQVNCEYHIQRAVHKIIEQLISMLEREEKTDLALFPLTRKQ